MLREAGGPSAGEVAKVELDFIDGSYSLKVDVDVPPPGVVAFLYSWATVCSP